MKESHTGTYLGFYINEVKFAINVFNVLSIQEMTKVTKVPKAPTAIKGLIKYQDKSIPLVDTAQKLGIGAGNESNGTSIILLEYTAEHEQQIAILVDSVEDVFQIEKNDILPLPSHKGLTTQKFIEGVYANDKDFTMIMNVGFAFEESNLEGLPSLSETAMNPSDKKNKPSNTNN
jgi:purine-binding chemotaxis protein CheW